MVRKSIDIADWILLTSCIEGAQKFQNALSIHNSKKYVHEDNDFAFSLIDLSDLRAHFRPCLTLKKHIDKKQNQRTNKRVIVSGTMNDFYNADMCVRNLLMLSNDLLPSTLQTKQISQKVHRGFFSVPQREIDQWLEKLLMCPQVHLHTVYKEILDKQ